MLPKLAQFEIKTKRISNWRIGELRRDNVPWFPDYIPQRMRGMAVNSGPQVRSDSYSAI